MDRQQYEGRRLPDRAYWRKNSLATLGEARNQRGLGVMAIHVRNLKDANGDQSEKGADPFVGLKIDGDNVVGIVYGPPYKNSTYVYEHIADNIEDWVKAAIKARK